MSYTVLARKWRPRGFAEMVGQEHVIRALSNALDGDRLHHAFLFAGTRGVGKTTVARILAKCLNCETGVSSTPCGTCAACVEIDDGLAVETFRQDAGDRRLADPARAGEEEGVVQPITVERIAEGADDVFLAHHFSKAPRAPFPSENGITH